MPVYSVSQLTRYIKDSLNRDSLLSDVWIAGEVSNLSQSGTGTLYFTLKDQSSQLRCVMFRNGHGSQFLANGKAILGHGRVSFYEVRGELQLYTDLVQPEGVGEKHLELEQLKARLETEGLFDTTRKRPMPLFPQRIGVITSPFGAVWHDIQNVISRRYPLVELLLAPTPVQGSDAASGIIEAFQLLNLEEEIDLIILARGGGSLEELWPFNEEAVAKAIYGSKAPVISGVGHETDYTIADMVADLRAPTPSAAAELAVPDARELQISLLSSERKLLDSFLSLKTQRNQAVQRLIQRLNSRAPDTQTPRQRIDDFLRAVSVSLDGALALGREHLKGLTSQLLALRPEGVLERGYAIVQKEPSGEVVSSLSQVRQGDPLKIRVKDGSFTSQVTST